MQPVRIDPVDRRILNLLQAQPGINASAIGERIGLSQSAVWRRIQGLRDEGIAIFLIEQDVQRTLEITNRAYVIENGHVVLEGSSSELLHEDLIKKAYLGL